MTPSRGLFGLSPFRRWCVSTVEARYLRIKNCPECFGSGRDFYGDRCAACEPPFDMDQPPPEQERRLDVLLNPPPARLAELRAMPYRDYLWTPEWRQRRAMHLRMADFTCDRCFTRKRDYRAFQVHHLSYKRLGQEAQEDLEVLCPDCHRREHGITT